MRQFSQGDSDAATAKLGLYTQDEDGNWRVDPRKEALRMANHTRCYHTKPDYATVEVPYDCSSSLVRELSNTCPRPLPEQT